MILFDFSTDICNLRVLLLFLMMSVVLLFCFFFWFYIAGTNIQTNEEVAIKLVSDVDHLCLRSYSNLSNLFVLFFVGSFVCWSLKSCMNDLFGNWFGKGGFILLSQFLELVVKLVSGCVFVLVLLMSFIGVCCCFYSWCICLFDCVFTELLVVVVFFFQSFWEADRVVTSLTNI